MPHYEKCSSCNGYGYFSCEDCLCQICEGKGKISCSKCVDGYQPCYFCDSTGLISKKLLFVSYSVPCPECKGSKKIRCLYCEGTGFNVCSDCKGTGKKNSCSICHGTRKIQCSDCIGTGKIESQWFKSIKAYSVDRLNFESNRRKREIDLLYKEISHLESQLRELESWHDRELERNPWIASHPGAYPSGLDSIPRDIRIIENKIDELKDEIDAIDQVISDKII